MKTHPSRLLAACATAFALVSAIDHSPAALIVSEQFDYSTGSIATNNGGTGFSDAWAGSQVITTPGLTYTGMTTAGNASSDNSGSLTLSAVRPFDATGLYTHSGSSPFNINSGGPLWVSFLFNTPSTSDNVMLAGLFGNTAGDFSVGSGIRIRGDGTVTTHVRDNQGTTTGGGTYAIGTTHLALLKFTFTSVNNSDTVQLWLNPTLGSDETGLGAALAQTSANIQATGSGVNGGSFYMRGTNSYIGTIDEIRVGTALADVLPIPEPGTSALLALAIGGLLAVRRRRA